MENTKEIQKEFEILVSELERLKSINELTSSNADSAKTVVNEIDNFVKSVEQFKTAVDKELNERSYKIDILLKQLDETILSIESNTRKSVTEHSQKLKELHEKSDIIINQNKEALSKKLNKFADTLSNLSESILSAIDNSTSKISEKTQEQNNQTQSQISNISGLIKQSISSIESNFNYKFQDLNEQIKQNKKLSNLNKMILIVSSIVTIGLLIILLMK